MGGLNIVEWMEGVIHIPKRIMSWVKMLSGFFSFRGKI